MKTTLVWAVRNVPGSLYRCLGCFAERKINLSRLESRPSRGVRWEYVFWADMDSDPDDPGLRRGPGRAAPGSRDGSGRRRVPPLRRGVTRRGVARRSREPQPVLPGPSRPWRWIEKM